MTNEEIQFIVSTTKLVAERIQAAGEIYSGHLYGDLLDVMSFDAYKAAVHSLKSGGLVTEILGHLLVWRGIPKGK
jgi:hypothetical protein